MVGSPYPTQRERSSRGNAGGTRRSAGSRRGSVAGGPVVDVDPAQGADLAPPHLDHEENHPRSRRPRLRPRSRATRVGLDATAAGQRTRTAARSGGPGRPRLPDLRSASGPPVGRRERGRSFPGGTGLAGEVGPEALLMELGEVAGQSRGLRRSARAGVECPTRRRPWSASHRPVASPQLRTADRGTQTQRISDGGRPLTLPNARPARP